MRGAMLAGLLLAAGPGLCFGADDAAGLAEGRALFTQGAVPACAVCHTLKDAGSSGQIGPLLDELKPSADRVATALRNGIGVMPSYRETLTEEQILALARYVSTVTHKATR